MPHPQTLTSITKAIAGVVTATLMAGCPSYSMLQSPKVVDEGETRFTVAPGFIGAGASGGAFGLPTTEFGIRHGIADKTDFGFRIYPVGMAFDFKRQFVESASFDLSFNPGVSLYYLGAAATGGAGGAGGGYLHLPVLMGINLGDTFSLVLGPRMTLAGGAATGGAGGLVGQVGTGLGFHMAFSETFSLMPEVTVMKSVFSTGGNTVGGTLFQAGVGMNFGGKLRN